jgi:NAD(P)-dependent dehydrogenase (short-subunit alcohol dehydrogenase family)
MARSIDPTGARACFIAHDVTDEKQWTSVIQQTVERFGSLSILVNNAGVGAIGTVEDDTYERWKWFQAINLDSVFLGTRAAFAAAMKISGGGSIINLASVSALVADAAFTAYATSKAGVRIFSKAAALHCAKSGYGIRVNTVCPGCIDTALLQDVIKSTGDVDGMQVVVRNDGRERRRHLRRGTRRRSRGRWIAEAHLPPSVPANAQNWPSGQKKESQFFSWKHQPEESKCRVAGK